MTHPDTTRADLYARELTECEERERALHTMHQAALSTVRQLNEVLRETTEALTYATYAVERAERAEAKVHRVAALHVEAIDIDGCCHYCAECTPDAAHHADLVAYPCATIRALEGRGNE